MHPLVTLVIDSFNASWSDLQAAKAPEEDSFFDEAKAGAAAPKTTQLS